MTAARSRTGWIGVFLLSAIIGFGQSNLRTKKISFARDTVWIDTLSIIPGSVSLNDPSGAVIDSSRYRIDYVNALLIKQSSFGTVQDVVITYRVFPYLFSKPLQHKDLRRIQNNSFSEPYVYIPSKNKEPDFFKTEGLSKSGSISRGLSFGNNQDVVLNSALNLQLAGKLSDNMDLLLAATDQNIPIQPEGNTQQLQEFDRVFIQLGIKDLPSNGKTTVTAGDFQIAKPEGYFMNFNKKLQGLSMKTEVRTKKPALSGVEGAEVIQATASAAVSKGKFAKNVSVESSNGNSFNGQKQERNQGAYKLRGAENEQFIIVLAATEAVYLDGQLLERGLENDYVIDYNTAEIMFTPKNLITKDKRIAVEFQYSDKNYARSLVHAGTSFGSKKVSARVNVFSEQDNRNRPLQQELEDPEKLLLASIGDSLHMAVAPSADSVPFNTTEVLYEKKDSLSGSFFYPGIYVHSSDSSKAHYRLSFSLVGPNNGNYRVKQSSANGKVYEWVLPDTLTGLPQGSYEPVRLLIAPKQKQMVSAGADIRLTKNSRLSFEGAMSNSNLNTFSKLEKKDDKGLGGKVDWEMKVPFHRSSAADTTRNDSTLNGWHLVSQLRYEFLQKTFSPIERFRNVEFERDWNRGSVLQEEDQHVTQGRLGVAKKNNLLAYDYRSLSEGSVYSGTLHGTTVRLEDKGWLLNGDGSYLESKGKMSRTDFLRQRFSLSKKIALVPSGKTPGYSRGSFAMGVREQTEDNRFRDKTADSLLAGSARFMEWEPFAELKDSSGNKYFLSYKQRTDYARSTLPGAELHRATLAENYGGGLELFSNPKNQLRITGAYRRLKVTDTTLSIVKPENTVIGRLEHNLSLLKGFFSTATFYEVGSGLELKKEFMYLEVAEGQGTHIYRGDDNGNGLKDLDEFELAAFSYEANYIKVWIPTDDYISTYTHQFSEVLSIRPSTKWSGKKGFRKLVSRFSNQTAFRTDRKTTQDDLRIAYNPLLPYYKDSALVTLNSSLRNTVFFNQNDPVFGMELTLQDVQNKSLLVNDTVFRSHNSRETKFRWNLNRKWTLQGMYKDGKKTNDSRFFDSRNYSISYFEAEPKISILSGSSMRLVLSYKYSEKKNGGTFNPMQRATSQNFGGEFKYSMLNKGSFTSKINFIQVEYNGAAGTALAYEMLEGLKAGNNFTWGVAYSRTLASNIQLTLSYDGRHSPGIKVIHTGNAQVRAFF